MVPPHAKVSFRIATPHCLLFVQPSTQVRGTDMVSPHGVPVDLLDRLVIIRTQVGKVT